MWQIGIALFLTLFIIFFLLAKNYPQWRKAFLFFTLIVSSFYLGWRIFFTLSFVNVASGISSVVLLLTEILGTFSSFVFTFLMFNKVVKPPIAPLLTEDYYPSVDILISTYNEPLKLVLATALAAKALPYPNKKVFICDDGSRKDLQKYAAQIDVHYITRTEHTHAKAGNINHALIQTTGEFILLLDADFIVKKGLLMEAIPYFKDPKTAMVQYPQTFYNKDPYQLVNKRYYNEQDFFMRFIEPNLAKHDSMVHIGTNAVVRRTALEEIGYVPTSSITEDMCTGMLLQNAGYKTLYINKAYALGIAPFRLRDLKSQRQRWARGVLQAFKTIKPWRLPGLNSVQKLLYFNGYLYWYTAIQKLIYLVSPALFPLFGIFVVKMETRDIAIFILPFLFLVSMNMRILVGKERSFLSSHVYDTLVAPWHTAAIIKELFHPEKIFRVTPKQVETDEKMDLKPVLPHIIISVWLLAGLAASAIRIIWGSPYWAGLLICSGWMILNLYALFFSILAAKKSNIESAGEALSVSVFENVQCGNSVLHVSQMSFDGFWADYLEGVKTNFNTQEIYTFTVVRTGLEISAQFVEKKDGKLLFTFKNLSTEAAVHLSAYYAEKLHAVKRLEFDMNVAPLTGKHKKKNALDSDEEET